MMEEFVKTAGKESKREVQESYPLTNTQEGFSLSVLQIWVLPFTISRIC